MHPNVTLALIRLNPRHVDLITKTNTHKIMPKLICGDTACIDFCVTDDDTFYPFSGLSNSYQFTEKYPNVSVQHASSYDGIGCLIVADYQLYGCFNFDCIEGGYDSHCMVMTDVCTKCHNVDQMIIKCRMFENMKVTYTANGEDHCAIIADGHLYTCGYNNYGQLGHNDLINRSSPTLVQGLTNVTHVKCGKHVTFVISDHQLYAFGRNERNQLGLGHTMNVLRPVSGYTFADVQDIICVNNLYPVSLTYVIADHRLHLIAHAYFSVEKPKQIDITWTHVSQFSCNYYAIYFISRSRVYWVCLNSRSIKKKLLNADPSLVIEKHECTQIDNILYATKY